MVHLSRMRDKSRKVLEILEIDGYDIPTGEIMTHTLFEYEVQGEDRNGRLLGQLRQVGELHHRQKLDRAGVKL
jgi:pilus assembly protein CpaF